MRRVSFLALCLLLLTGIFSCSPLRRLKEKEVLLNKNIVKSDKPELNEGIRSIIKQKPNRRILGLFRFHLWVYTLADRENDSTRFRNWVKNTIGEKPVLLDSMLTRKSTGQIRQFMINSGYFDATVSDTTIYKNPKKANVSYLVHAGAPYFIRDYKKVTNDRQIRHLIERDSMNSLIKPGNLFDASVIQQERNRVTTLLKNEGYYYFSQAYIRFDADSTLPDNQVSLKMIISRINEARTDTLNNILPTDHLRYQLNEIYIQTDFNPLQLNINSPDDTLIYKRYHFISYNKKLKFNPETIRHHLLLRPGELFQVKNLENSYKMLGSLNVFKFINIKFEPVKDDSLLALPRLNCFIFLTPGAKQEHREEIEGTHNGGALGVAGTISYRNKNFLKGAELLEIKLKGALESSQNFSDSTGKVSRFPFFNTFEIGPEINLSFPKILLPRRILPNKLRHESPFANEYTTFTANYDLQQLPEFKRTIANFSIQWFFNESETKRHYIFPAEINFVNVRLNSAFKAKLEEINDPFLNYAYADHLITDGRWTYILSTQNLKKKVNFFFFRSNLEFAGNSLWILNHWFSKSPQEDNSFTILNTRFAQYIKPDVDFRFYQVINANNTLVYRIAGGIGIPYLNSFALPFEKAFYSGGSNDLRAYRARTVGPGSYFNTYRFEQTGEIKINVNLEFRFDIFKILQGAAFIDAGNIWLLKNDINRPGGQFKTNTFIDEMAIGGGLGARLNFTFFIIRLDAGVPFKDPSLPAGERWVLKNPRLKSIVFNLGIGYPF